MAQGVQDQVPLLASNTMSLNNKNDNGISYQNLRDNNSMHKKNDSDAVEHSAHVVKNKLGTINGWYAIFNTSIIIVI